MTNTTPRPATAAQLSWLTAQLADWQAAGLLEPVQGTAILERYTLVKKAGVSRLLLTIGAVFVGIGLIWLVAANLDAFPPLGRFVVVAAIWLGLLVGAEALARRREHGGAIPSPVVGAVRIIAALAFGGVVFQAAQSLQVPADSPVLVAAWAAGALLHAYTVRATGPLVVGLAAGTAYVLWQTLEESASGLTAVVAILACGVVAAGVGAVHTRWRPEFAPAWREVGAFLGLAGLFGAALPFVNTHGFHLTPGLTGVVLAAAVAIGVAAWRAPKEWVEPVAAAAILVVGTLLTLWDAGTDTSKVGVEAWAHAGISVTAYVGAALYVAVLGSLRDSTRLTALATTALVVFTTFQSFAVFAQIIQGAWLFLFLGLVLVGTGILFDRARRELAASLEGELR